MSKHAACTYFLIVMEFSSSPLMVPIPTNIWQIQLIYIYGILNRPKIQFLSISKSTNTSRVQKTWRPRDRVQSASVTKLSIMSMSLIATKVIAQSRLETCKWVRLNNRRRECVPLSYGPRKIRVKIRVFRRSILRIFEIMAAASSGFVMSTKIGVNIYIYKVVTHFI